MSRIIAISGWKRSGKDTAADYLINQHKFKRVGFADPLKEMVSEEYDIPLHYCYEDEFKEKPLLQYPVNPQDDFTEKISLMLEGEFKEVEGIEYWTPRALCILKGSINRAVTSDYWVKQAVKKIEQELQDPFNNGIVISDLRYRSEVRQLREQFGNRLSTIRINRFDTIDTTDPSERDLDSHKFDFVVENKQALENLYEKIEDIIE